MRASGRSRRSLVLDGLVLVAVAAVVAFPIAAYASATRAAAGDGDPAGVTVSTADHAGSLPPLPAGPAGTFHDAPVLVPGSAIGDATSHVPTLLGSRTAFRAALSALATAALGPDGAARLLALPAPDSASPAVLASYRTLEFPQAAAIVDPAIAAVPAGAAETADLTDLGALVQIGDADGLPVGPYPDATAATVLERARRGGSCAAQTDYLLEVLADTAIDPSRPAAEARITEERCPGDATPGWMLGEYRLGAGPGKGRGPAALANFRSLQQRYPHSPAGWSGEADVLLAQTHGVDGAGGGRLGSSEQFTRRAALVRAALLLDRARLLGGPVPDRGLVMSEASSWRLAGQPARAAPLYRQVLAFSPGTDAQEGLAAALEETDRYRQAATVLLRAYPATAAQASGALYAGTSSLQSLGRGRLAALTVQPPGGPRVFGAEGTVTFSLIPPARGGYDGLVAGLDTTSGNGMRLQAARDLLLAGDPAPAQRSADPLLAAMGRLDAGDVPEAGQAIVAGCAHPPDVLGVWCADASQLDYTVGIVTPPLLAFGAPPAPAAQLLDGVEFELEDTFRAAGKLADAARVTAAWARRAPRDFLALDQAGEVAFLRGDGRSVGLFGQAEAVAPAPGAAWAETLKQSEAAAREGNEEVALRLARDVDAQATGRLADVAAGQEAIASYQQAVRAGVSPAQLAEMVRQFEAGPVYRRYQAALPHQADDLQVAYAARVQAGEIGLRTGAYSGAVADYESARTLALATVSVVGSEYVPDALDTNEGLALVQAGRLRRGLSFLQAAVAADPGNPVFRQNVAYAERRLGWDGRAVADYRAALALDPSNYPAANDLGVLLARQHRPSEAVPYLRTAVAAGPDYALARFNLGVVLEQQGLGHFAEAEGDIARAVRTDPGLADQARLPQFDDGTVITTLDLSRPIPGGWHFAVAARVAPAVGGGLAFGAVLVGLVRELAVERGTDKLEEKALDRAAEGERRGRRWARWWSRRRPPAALALAATAAAVTWPLASSDGATWAPDVVLAGAALVLAAAYTRIHHYASRRSTGRLRHRTWVPALALAAGAAGAHLAFPPLPVAEPEEDEHRRRRWLAPLTLGGLAVVLLVVGRLTRVPAATAFGSGALVMTSAALVPVEPCDGAYLGSRRASLIGTAALLGVSVMLILHVL